MKNSQIENFPQIISETKDYLVINKPAGLAVHAGGNLQEETLVDWLINKYPKIKDVGEDPLRPGIVHRLDKEVSGLMVIAKNQASFNSLKNQFQDRLINKEYLALVHGQITKEADVINFSIVRSKEGHKMAAIPKGTVDLLTKRGSGRRDQGNINQLFKAREALTEFTVLQRFVNFSFVRVIIKTGRTHQIRVHFLAYGHPLVGDLVYFNKKSKIKNKKIGLNRIFLVSCRLSFTDLSGGRQDFNIPLPDDLKKYLPLN